MDNQRCAQSKRTRPAHGNRDAARKQQAASAAIMRPLIGSQQSTSSSNSQRSSSSNGHINDQQSQAVETPCKQIAELKLNSATKKTKTKKKLLATKSLSNLLPGRFFAKKDGSKNKANDNGNQIMTTRSFPNGAFQHETVTFDRNEDARSSIGTNDSSEPYLSILAFHRTNSDSASTIGLPPRSNSKLSTGYQPSSSTLRSGLAGLSPIAINGSSGCTFQNEMLRSVVASTPTLRMQCPKPQDNKQKHMRQQHRHGHDDQEAKQSKVQKSDQQHEASPQSSPVAQHQETKPNKTKKTNKYKPFKNTALVLRDVKNSIGLRMMASHESQAFAKLKEEIATPPTKLYSPFNIDLTPSLSLAGDEHGNENETTGKVTKAKTKRLNASKAKRERINTRQGRQQGNNGSSLNDSGLDCSISTIDDSMSSCNQVRVEQPQVTNDDKTPKYRIALRHKKHLMQTNTFASFHSPTGRLRETVKDVELFQQCIEDISEAIRARERT